MNKQINLVINGKGGVGKSFFAVNFVQYLKDCGIAHCAIDSDHENSTLKRFHPEAEFINLEHRREIDRVFTASETSDLLIIDCRAASTDLFIDFFDEVNLAEVLRSLDARLTVICPVNHEADSVEQLRILSDALHDRCAWVVVRNEAHSDAFKIYDGSKTRRHLVEEWHARKITMPRLRLARYRVERAQHTSHGRAQLNLFDYARNREQRNLFDPIRIDGRTPLAISRNRQFS